MGKLFQYNKLKVLILCLVVIVGVFIAVLYHEMSNIASPVVATSHEEEGIDVYWDDVHAATSYDVYRSYSKNDGRELIGTTKELHYLDKDITAGKRVYYSVCAKNKYKQSKLSNTVEDIVYKVFIETGHGIDENGDWDTGCTWNGDEEAELMIPIAKATAQYLKDNGVLVYTDAFSNNDSNLNKAIDFVYRNDINVFVNIHCDYDGAESGTVALYFTDEQKKLAKALNKGVHEYVKVADRGLDKRDDLETLCNKKVDCTSCLYETGCISKDNTVLKTKADDYGKGLAMGICNYLKIEYDDAKN